MSSPSIPVVSPAPLLSDLDKVVVYDSGGEEFERWRHTSARNQSQSSVVVVVDFLGVPKQTKFCPTLLKEGSMGRSAGKAGFLQGGQGKGASSVVIRGKHQASLSSGVGLSKRLHGRGLSAGPLESLLFSPIPGVPLEWSLSPPTPIPSITEVFLCKQVEALTTSLAAWEGELRQAREDCDAVQTEKEAMEQERNTLVRMATERALEVQGLQERLMQMEGQPTGEVEGRGRVPGGDALWAELEAVRRREDWLANKAALGLGAGALGPPGRCLRGVHVDSGCIDAGVRGSAPRVAAGDGAIGEVAGGASAMQCGGPRVVVGGGG
ncbi:hypothetical protein J132_10216 [Termitomyces sp. J132]|nr:hypothetical protein J132_10216 [Termitomyces sp. J132]